MTSLVACLVFCRGSINAAQVDHVGLKANCMVLYHFVDRRFHQSRIYIYYIYIYIIYIIYIYYIYIIYMCIYIYYGIIRRVGSKMPLKQLIVQVTVVSGLYIMPPLYD